MTPAWLIGMLGLALAGSSTAEMVVVGPGTYRPLYAGTEEARTIDVPAFALDVRPVSNADFLSFTVQNPTWGRDQTSRLFADDRYLTHWESSGSLGAAAQPDQPVVHVSWFAARAFCEARGARLPTESEWELAAMASAEVADATGDPVWRQTILDWYGRPSSRPLPSVESTPANFWGVHDLHGVVWEWVEDFGSTLVSADPREAGDGQTLRFCGAGAADAQSPDDYAAFMRVAFRSALKGRSTTKNLGFRCAKDVSP